MLNVWVDASGPWIGYVTEQGENEVTHTNHPSPETQAIKLAATHLKPPLTIYTDSLYSWPLQSSGVNIKWIPRRENKAHSIVRSYFKFFHNTYTKCLLCGRTVKEKKGLKDHTKAKHAATNGFRATFPESLNNLLKSNV